MSQTKNIGIVAPVPKGAWNSTSTYDPLNVVTDEGKAYIAISENTNVKPGTDSTVWMLFAQNGEDGEDGEQGAPGEPGQSALPTVTSAYVNDSVKNTYDYRGKNTSGASRTLALQGEDGEAFSNATGTATFNARFYYSGTTSAQRVILTDADSVDADYDAIGDDCYSDKFYPVSGNLYEIYLYCTDKYHIVAVNRGVA